MFESSTVCVITGASRGLGRAIAQTFAKEVSKHEAKSCFILTARSQDGLQETRDLVTALCPAGNLEVHCVVGDMSDMESLEELAKKILDKVNVESFSKAVLINNAGTIGDLSKFIIEHTNLADIRRYWDINLSSFLYLTSCFVTKFKSTCKVFVINIASLAAVQPIPAASLYCIGKAARNMAMRMLAAEFPEVRVLNYAPGPLDTAMSRQIAESSAVPETRQYFTKMFEEGTMVKLEDTTTKLLGILSEDSFENGAHIDYYNR